MTAEPAVPLHLHSHRPSLLSVGSSNEQRVWNHRMTNVRSAALPQATGRYRHQMHEHVVLPAITGRSAKIYSRPCQAQTQPLITFDKTFRMLRACQLGIVRDASAPLTSSDFNQLERKSEITLYTSQHKSKEKIYLRLLCYGSFIRMLDTLTEKYSENSNVYRAARQFFLRMMYTLQDYEVRKLTPHDFICSPEVSYHFSEKPDLKFSQADITRMYINRELSCLYGLLKKCRYCFDQQASDRLVERILQLSKNLHLHLVALQQRSLTASVQRELHFNPIRQ